MERTPINKQNTKKIIFHKYSSNVKEITWECIEPYNLINELVQETRNSIANALELCLSCTNASLCYVIGSVSDASPGLVEAFRGYSILLGRYILGLIGPPGVRGNIFSLLMSSFGGRRLRESS